MAYLVRKIERAKWEGSDVAGSRIKADVVASCLKPNKSELSVWFANNAVDVEVAKLATLAAMNKLATVDFVVIPLDEVEGAGLSVVASIPKEGPESMKGLHRDISDLDLDNLKTIAIIIQNHIAANHVKRMTRNQCKKVLLEALASQIFQSTELHVDLARHLGT